MAARTTGRSRKKGRTAADEATEAGLAALGLVAGEPVRWQRRSGGHWQQGAVIRREADGSLAVHDGDGAWRSLPLERLEVLRPGKRPTANRAAWEPLADRAERANQLRLW